MVWWRGVAASRGCGSRQAGRLCALLHWTATQPSLPRAFFSPPCTCPQAAFLEVLATEGDEAWAAGEAALAPALRCKPELAAEALAVAKAKGESGGRAAPWLPAQRLGTVLQACPAGPCAPCSRLLWSWHALRPLLTALACTCTPCPVASGGLARALLAAAEGDAARQQELVAALLPVYVDKVRSGLLWCPLAWHAGRSQCRLAGHSTSTCERLSAAVS